MTELTARNAYIEKHWLYWERDRYDCTTKHCGAIIVETRQIPGIGRIIKNHLYHLPSRWGLMVVTGKWALSAEGKKFWNTELAGITGEVLCIDEMYFVKVDSTVKYNELLTSKIFWEHVNQLFPQRVLIFQHDSLLLRSGIEEYLPHDYVGAPWKFQQHGGNGGLSLRNPYIMWDILNKEFPYKGNNEDVYFSDHVERVGGKLAPRDVCSRFSTESIFALGTFGLHDVEHWLSEEELQQIYNQYDK